MGVTNANEETGAAPVHRRIRPRGAIRAARSLGRLTPFYQQFYQPERIQPNSAHLKRRQHALLADRLLLWHLSHKVAESG